MLATGTACLSANSLVSFLSLTSVSMPSTVRTVTNKTRQERSTSQTPETAQPIYQTVTAAAQAPAGTSRPCALAPGALRACCNAWTPRRCQLCFPPFGCAFFLTHLLACRFIEFIQKAQQFTTDVIARAQISVHRMPIFPVSDDASTGHG